MVQCAWTLLTRPGHPCLVSGFNSDMINIFEVFLPQLLHYPNPTDPLNGEAAALLMREPNAYEAKVKEYVTKYATSAAMDAADDASSDGEMSPVDSYSDEDAPGMEL